MGNPVQPKSDKERYRYDDRKLLDKLIGGFPIKISLPISYSFDIFIV